MHCSDMFQINLLNLEQCCVSAFTIIGAGFKAMFLGTQTGMARATAFPSSTHLTTSESKPDKYCNDFFSLIGSTMTTHRLFALRKQFMASHNCPFTLLNLSLLASSVCIVVKSSKLCPGNHAFVGEMLPF